MNFLTRVKYLFGSLIVLAAVSGLTVSMNDRISDVQAASAHLQSRDYKIGTSYSGVVVHSRARVGKTVKAGQELFTIKSSELARDIANGAVKPNDSTFDIRRPDKLVVRAPSAGKVVSTSVVEGAFVQADATLARVQMADTTHVEANFHLTPREYALIRKADHVTVTLPNDHRIQARITRITVATSGRQAETTVRAQAPQLGNRGLFSSGTPVDVQVKLRKSGLVHRIQTAAAGLLTPGGAR